MKPWTKYLSLSEAKKIAFSAVIQDVKSDMKQVAKSAAASFYADYTPNANSYNRTYSFSYDLADPLYMNCREEKLSNGGIRLLFTFEASDVSVSNGDPSWAFDADFIHGFHGGPHNIGNNTYSWTPVPKMKESPWDLISNYVNEKYK